uniref:Polyprotein n=1 Tax=Solanum tuberosum TaxID=4113 RepID=M1CZ13_SOLTU
MPSKGNEVDTVANIANANTSDTLTALMSEMVNWIIDTGASNHMVHNIGLMTQCTDLGDKNNKKVNLHTGGQVPISHIGDSLVLKDKIVHDVLFIPEFKYNLLSVSQLTKQLRCVVLYFPEKCIIGSLQWEGTGDW